MVKTTNSRESVRLKMGVKYCGGCHPGYDRVAAVQRIAKRLSGRITLVPWSDPEVVSVIVICGCRAACAEVSVSDLPTHWVMSDADADATTSEYLYRP